MSRPGLSETSYTILGPWNQTSSSPSLHSSCLLIEASKRLLQLSCHLNRAPHCIINCHRNSLRASLLYLFSQNKVLTAEARLGKHCWWSLSQAMRQCLGEQHGRGSSVIKRQMKTFPNPVGKTPTDFINTQCTVLITPIAFLSSCLSRKASMEKESIISNVGLCHCV